MENYSYLSQTLKDIHANIKNINQKYSNIKTSQELMTNTQALSRNLEKIELLLNLKTSGTREPSMIEFTILGIPYEIIPEDALIDVAISYNSFDAQMMIVPPPNTTLYPLDFPYSGARGPRAEIEQMISQYLGKTALAVLATVLGNEPIDIQATEFKATSILKADIGLDGKNTLVGIIDTGIDYTNPVFLDSNGKTRIVSIWDQTIGSDSPYGYGTVYEQDLINDALASPDPFGVAPHQDELGHGTILAGIAAGRGQYEEGVYEGIAPGAQLAIVKLKAASPDIQKFYHGFYNPMGFSALDIALAFQYLATLATQMRKPISICLPSGSNSGSHDGTNILDSIICSYSSNPGISAVLAVGEEANKGHHASGNLADNKEQIIKLTIAKGQLSFAGEIWGDFGDKIEVLLTPPSIGDTIPGPIILNNPQVYNLSEMTSVWSYGISFDVDTGCQVIRFRFENPTEGEWTIKVIGLAVVSGVYHIWIPKTGMILPETVLSPDSPFTTIYNTSTARGIIAIGCYDKRSLTACGSSGRGFTRDKRVSPDYIVEGIDVLGPLPEGKWGRLTGTAPSSAIGAGVTSLIYENQLIKGERLANTIVMKAILINQVKGQPTVSYPNRSSGYGLIDLNSELP